MAFPKADRQYALITDAATGTADTPGGLGAILTQVDKDGNFYAISFASRQLKDHEKNYSPFLLEATAAVWGMDFFNQRHGEIRNTNCLRRKPEKARSLPLEWSPLRGPGLYARHIIFYITYELAQ